MKVTGLRWFMIGLVFLATVINYIDRQTVSVLKTAISQDLGLSNADYAAIQNSFLVFYGISQLVSGRLYDVIGTRLGFVFSIVVWSLAALAHATARSAASFGVFRAALGFGEAGNWPGAAKVVGEWFPVRERAFGMGIFNTGAAVGGALSPPIIAWLATTWGWRPTFVVTGLLGFLWLGLWLLFFHAPGQAPVDHRSGTRPHTGRASLRGLGPAVAAGLGRAPALPSDLGRRPGALHHRSHLVALHLLAAVVPPGGARFQPPAGRASPRGSRSSPAASAPSPAAMRPGRSFQQGMDRQPRASRTVMIFGAMLTPAGILAMRANDPYVALAWMAVVLFGFQVWVNNLQTLPSDFFPNSAVGSVFGLGGLAAAIASVALHLGHRPRRGCLGLQPRLRGCGRARPPWPCGHSCPRRTHRESSHRSEGNPRVSAEATLKVVP
jgi:ACS family hexuronate transporter-like MFS transporter